MCIPFDKGKKNSSQSAVLIISIIIDKNYAPTIHLASGSPYLFLLA